MKKHILEKFRGDFFRVLETTDNSQIAVMTIEPDGNSGSEGIHKGDQILVILEGEAQVHIGDEVVKVTRHEVVVIPSKTKHLIVNKSKKDVFFLNVYSTPEY